MMYGYILSATWVTEQAWTGDNVNIIIASTSSTYDMLLHKQKRYVLGAIYHSGERAHSIEVVNVQCILAQGRG